MTQEQDSNTGQSYTEARNNYHQSALQQWFSIAVVGAGAGTALGALFANQEGGLAPWEGAGIGATILGGAMTAIGAFVYSSNMDEAIAMDAKAMKKALGETPTPPQTEDGPAEPQA